jgi:hypothetical protein
MASADHNNTKSHQQRCLERKEDWKKGGRAARTSFPGCVTMVVKLGKADLNWSRRGGKYESCPIRESPPFRGARSAKGGRDGPVPRPLSVGDLAVDFGQTGFLPRTGFFPRGGLTFLARNYQAQKALWKVNWQCKKKIIEFTLTEC